MWHLGSVKYTNIHKHKYIVAKLKKFDRNFCFVFFLWANIEQVLVFSLLLLLSYIVSQFKFLCLLYYIEYISNLGRKSENVYVVAIATLDTNILLQYIEQIGNERREKPEKVYHLHTHLSIQFDEFQLIHRMLLLKEVKLYQCKIYASEF